MGYKSSLKKANGKKRNAKKTVKKKQKLTVIITHFTIRKHLLFMAIPILFILGVITAISAREKNTDGILDKDKIAYSFQQIVPMNLRDKIFKNFIYAVDGIPDDKARKGLQNVLGVNKLEIMFDNFYGEMAYFNWQPALHVNWHYVLDDKVRIEYLWSTLVHENEHIQDHLSGRIIVRRISECAADAKLERTCSFEYFALEFRGIRKQVVFLVALDKLYVSPPALRDYIDVNDIDRSVLLCFRKTYIETGFVNPVFRKHYDEFEAIVLEKIEKKELESYIYGPF